jgi:hypothetical protein
VTKEFHIAVDTPLPTAVVMCSSTTDQQPEWETVAQGIYDPAIHAKGMWLQSLRAVAQFL